MLAMSLACVRIKTVAGSLLTRNCFYFYTYTATAVTEMERSEIEVARIYKINN